MAEITIVAALAEPPPPAGGSGPHYDKAVELYAVLQREIAEYNALTSHSAPDGPSYSVEVAAKERIILQFYEAYLRALGLSNAAAGTDPRLLSGTRAQTFDWSQIQLHNL